MEGVVVDAGSSNVTLKNAKDVVQNDLSYTHELSEKFMALEGNRPLITGGAGFLGYYLVQSVLYWNVFRHDQSPIRITVLDNFLRGVPEWLLALDAQHSSLRFIKHDITQPLPDRVGGL